MRTPVCPDIGAIYTRDARDPSILVADGYGLRLNVERGHLHIADGLGAARRTRSLPRVERTISRIVILGHSGSITLEAIRWCTDVGIALVQVDADGRLLLSAGSTGVDDPRLRRAQALAAGTAVGLSLTRGLLVAKLDRQADVLDSLGEPTTAAVVRGCSARLADATDIDRLRELEAEAANSYFAAWTRQVRTPFVDRDASRVPDHWLGFDGRRSVLDRGRSPRKAANPVCAILNYAYALAEAECRLALLAVGLDPGLGVLHTDKRGRDSLALDLIEPLRPEVDATVLALLKRRRLRRTDFHETADGNCRVLAPLTHELAEASRPWRLSAAHWAEHAAHLFADSSSTPIPKSTPLTGANRRAGSAKGGRRPRSQAPAPSPQPRACHRCGAVIADTAAKLCPSCWSVTRAALARDRALAGAAELARCRAAGTDPTTTPAARQSKRDSLAARKREQLAWEAANSASPDLDWARDVLPGLADVTLSRMQAATGLSLSACSRIRSGQLTPYARHWLTLRALIGSGEGPTP